MTAFRATATAAPGLGLDLGLDAGGTETRWALAGSDGRLRGEGRLASISGLQLQSIPGPWRRPAFEEKR